MKRFLALSLALVLLLAIPASADHRQAGYEEIVRWAGCRATLYTDDTESITGSFYTSRTHALYIGTLDEPGLSPELARMVLYHEIGHCLQEQSDLFTGTSALYRELDADRWAADLACARGEDGVRLLRDLFLWAKEHYEYDGDPAHGTLEQRISAGTNAAMCRFAPPQVPLASRSEGSY